MGVELPLRVVVTILECCVTFSGVKLSIRSFVLFIRDEAGELVAFEHGKVIITLHFRRSKHGILFEMVSPLDPLNSIEYYNKPDNVWKDYYYAQAFTEESSLQRGGNLPFYRGPLLQRGYGLGSIFKSVARSVMPSLKEI